MRIANSHLLSSTSAYLVASALIGAVVWGAFAILCRPEWAAWLFLLAPLVLVPLTLRLIDHGGLFRTNCILWRETVLLQPLAAWLLLPSFWLESGPLAAAVAGPWFGFTIALAWVGLTFLRAGRCRLLAFALIYSAIGGGWLILARLGMRPLALPDVLVLATAVHFHFAGFLLPIVAGLVAQDTGKKLAFRLAWAIVIGVPLVAAGITLAALGTRLVELPATVFLAIACVLMAVAQFRVALAGTRSCAFFLVTSSISMICAMFLAVVYAFGAFLQVEWLDIPTMLATHGLLQAFGFALSGVIGWSLLLESATRAPLTVAWPSSTIAKRGQIAQLVERRTENP